jgi:hypothetical protein
VLKSSSKNMMVLNTRVRRGTLVGTLTTPLHFTEDVHGEFSGITRPLAIKPVTGRWKGTSVELMVGTKPDWDRIPMALRDEQHAQLDWTKGKVPPWQFERTAPGQDSVVASDWPEYDLDPEIVVIRQRLRALAADDLAARSKSPIDQPEIDQLSKNAESLLEAIFASYGWPKISVLGAQPANDFWLLVQHQSPALQKHMLSAMKTNVDLAEASKENYAYLFDRVQVNEGKAQHWGTQSRCENGRPILYPLEDAAHVEDWRRE